MTRGSKPVRRGFSLLEATLAVLVVSLVALVALEAAGTTARVQSSVAQRQTAERLAESLLAEVLGRRYRTPSDTTGLLRSQANSYDRVNFLGVESFHGLDESPVRAADGTAITDASWRRTCRVSFVDRGNPNTASAGDTGLRRIEVSVFHNGRLVLTRTALKGAE